MIKYTIKKRIIPFFYLMPLIILLVCFNLYPILSSIYMSFKNISYTDRSGSFAGLNNYLNVLKETRFWRVSLNSFGYTCLAILLVAIVGLFLASLLNRDIPLKQMFRTINILPWVVPPVMIAIIFKWILSKNYSPINDILLKLHILTKPIDWLGSINIGVQPFTLPLISLVLVYVWLAYPFTFVIFLSGMQSISEDIYDAAKVDGASYMKQFFYITLPLLKPVMIVTLSILFIWTFQYFNIIYMLTQGGPRGYTELLSIMIYNDSFKNSEIARAASLGVLMLLFLILPTFYYIRTTYIQIKGDR